MPITAKMTHVIMSGPATIKPSGPATTTATSAHVRQIHPARSEYFGVSTTSFMMGIFWVTWESAYRSPAAALRLGVEVVIAEKLRLTAGQWLERCVPCFDPFGPIL